MIVAIVIGSLALILVIVYIISNASVNSKLSEYEVKINVKKEYEGALKYLEPFMEKNPSNVKVHFLLAECYFHTGKYSRAISEYNHLLNMKKYEDLTNSTYIHSQLARIYIEQSRLDEAEKEYAYCLKSNPDDFDLYAQMADMLFNTGTHNNIVKSIKYYSKAIELAPFNNELKEKIVIAYYEAKNLPFAGQRANEIYDKNEDNVVANFYLGKINLKENDYEHAANFFIKTVNSKIYRADSLINLGICYYNIQKYDNALDYLNTFLGEREDTEYTNKTLLVMYMIGLCYEGLKLIDDAMKYFQQVYKINKQFRDVQVYINKYEDVIQADILKDMIIGSVDQYKKSVTEFLENLEFVISNIQEIDQENLLIFSVKIGERRLKLGEKGDCIVAFNRSEKAVSVEKITQFINLMRTRHISKGFYFSFSEFYSDAKELAVSRSVVLIDKKKLKELAAIQK